MNKRYKKAYTLAEALLAIIIIGISTCAMMMNLKPQAMESRAILKAGANMYAQIDFALKNLLAKRSINYTMENLIAIDDTNFSITDEGADEKFIAILKKVLIPLRNVQVSDSYKALDISTWENTGPQKPTSEDDPTLISWTISDFTQGMVLKNHAYLAIKLNGNCTTNEVNIYSPVTKLKNTATNSCGLIFYDINAEKSPNKLMVDQYIVSFGRMGLK